MTCIRGCTRHVLHDDGRREEEARPATVGLLCRGCSGRILEALADIPKLYDDLPSLDEMGRSEGEKVSHGKIAGSPALIRLDVMVLRGDGEKGDGVMPVVHTIFTRVELFSEESGQECADISLRGMVAFLSTWHANLLGMPWADEYFAEIRDVHIALKRATGAPRPVGRCFGFIVNSPCGRLLYPPSGDQSFIECPDETCGRRYSGADLLKLQIQGEREGVA